jgi:hypothetical protein
VTETPEELEYYRTVEDLLAILRGAPHVLPPKDIHLLRGWWRDRIPLAAVTAGLTEVFAQRRERQQDAVISLSYCRHAIRRHARRLQDSAVGSSDDPDAADTRRASQTAEVERLAISLRDAALRQSRRRLRDLISAIAEQVREARAAPATTLDEILFSLEAALLGGCWEVLDDSERDRIDHQAEEAAAASRATGKALERTRRAMRDRELRAFLGLPRLELG